jgi:2-methylisocitrate lyase-like PEP mutase family enzyme
LTAELAELADLAERLRALHSGPEPLLLPNAWDVSSALAVERAGADAVATTSSGVAASLGYPDGEAIPADQMLDAVRRIASAVSVPVTADLEAGYGLPAQALVDRLLGAGAVGVNLEDTVREGTTASLGPMERQVERIAAVRAAAEAAGVPVVLNARIDVFLRGDAPMSERLEEGLRRARAYRDAGADCVYPIWLTDRDAIARFVAEAGAPVNVLLRPGSPPVEELGALGVRRISVGGGLWRQAMRLTEEVARALLSGQGAPFAELGED